MAVVLNQMKGNQMSDRSNINIAKKKPGSTPLFPALFKQNLKKTILFIRKL